MSALLKAAVNESAATVNRVLNQIEDGEIDISAEGLREARELLRVLAHVIDGMDVRRAFGAPGDWGYHSPIGKGVIELFNASRPAPTARGLQEKQK